MSDAIFRVHEVLNNQFATVERARDSPYTRHLCKSAHQQQYAIGHGVWLRRQVLAGLDSANAGRLVPVAEVEAKFAARRAATRRRLNAPE